MTLNSGLGCLIACCLLLASPAPLVIPPAHAAEASLENEFSQLEQAYEQGDFPTALAVLKRIEARKLDSLDIWVLADLKAMVYYWSGNYPQAERALKHKLELYQQKIGSQHPDDWHYLLYALLWQQKYDDVFTLAEEAYANSCYGCALPLAHAALMTGELQTALKLYDEMRTYPLLEKIYFRHFPQAEMSVGGKQAILKDLELMARQGLNSPHLDKVRQYIEDPKADVDLPPLKLQKLIDANQPEGVLSLLNQGLSPHSEASWRENAEAIFDNQGPLLVWAASLQHDQLFRHLLTQKADPNARETESKMTVLMYLCQQGKQELATLLLDQGADPHLIGRRDQTALTYAVGHGHFNLVQLLESQGVEISKDPGRGNALASTAENGNLMLMQYLLGKGLNVRYSDKKGNTLLHFAAMNGKLDVIKFLLAKGLDLHARNQNGLNALSHAAAKDQLELLDFLLSQGLALDGTGSDGKTALAHAAESGALAAVKFLASKGAKLNTQDSMQYTPLLYASQGGYTDVIRYLLEKGADPKQKDDSNNSALHMAANSGEPTALHLLLEQGLDPNAQNKEKQTPLMLAIKQPKATELARLLLAKGAKLDTQDDLDKTALIKAVAEGHLAPVQLLIEAGANPYIKDIEGNTAIDYALQYTGRPDIIRFLERYQ
ncbi:MAG: hypothetical protein CVV27_03240 [Candidatus Melainabacteria bacterium HGW-Melainabacteria-1]|nr:MAG: hypothetical protein CVV27_03240 [Candidatus Melainabacteria bacterium HGW-Melainabacteria-1]